MIAVMPTLMVLVNSSCAGCSSFFHPETAFLRRSGLLKSFQTRSRDAGSDCSPEIFIAPSVTLLLRLLCGGRQGATREDASEFRTEFWGCIDICQRINAVRRV